MLYNLHFYIFYLIGAYYSYRKDHLFQKLKVCFETPWFFPYFKLKKYYQVSFYLREDGLQGRSM